MLVFSDRKYLTIDQLLRPLYQNLVLLLLKGPLPEAVSYNILPLKKEVRVVIENSHVHTFSQPSGDFSFLGVKSLL